MQYIFEFTACLLLFWTMDLLSSRKTIQPPFYYFWAALSSACLPLFFVSLGNTTIDLTQLWSRYAEGSFEYMPLAISYSGNITIAISDILALLWFAGFAWFSFRLTDNFSRTEHLIGAFDEDSEEARLSVAANSYAALFYRRESLSAQDYPLLQAARSRQFFFHKLPLLLTEVIYVIFWFHPLAYWCRNSFAKTSALYAERAPRKRKTLTPLWSAGMASLCLFLLFSGNLAKQLPLGGAFSEAEEKLSAGVSHPLFDLEKSRKGTVLDWGHLDLPIVSIPDNPSVPVIFRTPLLNRPYFKTIKDAEVKLYKDGEKQRIVKLEALFNSPDFAEPLRVNGREEFRKYVSAVSSQREVTALLKITTESGEEWLSALAISRYNRLYTDHPEMQAFAGEAAYFTYRLSEAKPFFKVETASDYVEEEDAIYTLKWGEVKIILEKYANPNVFRGDLDIDLDALIEGAGDEIEVLKNGETRRITKFSINRFDLGQEQEDDRFYLRELDEIDEKYAVKVDKALLENCTPGTVFRLMLETEDIRIAPAFIRVIDPYEPFYSKLSAARHNDDNPEFTFQVVNLPDRKTTLKADTSAAENARNLEIYGDRSRYEIIHIPGFKTNRRLLSADDFIWWEEEDKEPEKQSAILYLPEYTAHIGDAVGLWWGENVANPNSVNLTRRELKRQSGEPLRLKHGSKELEIIECEMLIQHLEEQPRVHLLRRKNGELRLPDFDETDTETSVAIQKIVVRTSEGLFFFPANFAFHVGKEMTDYELEIKETDIADFSSDTSSNRPGEYLAKWENISLKDYIADITGFNDNKVRMHGAVRNPTLSVDYSSEKINTRYGLTLTLGELRRRYLFSWQYKFETLPSYRLGMLNSEKLLAYQVSEAEAENSSEEAEISGDTALLKAATPYQMSRFLEDRFDKHIYSVVDDENAYYFSLDISSFEAACQQLENDYGLRVIPGNYPVRFVDVYFLEKEGEW